MRKNNDPYLGFARENFSLNRNNFQMLRVNPIHIKKLCAQIHDKNRDKNGQITNRT